MSELAWVALRAASFVLLLQAAGGALFVAAFAHGLTTAPALRRGVRQGALGALAVLAAQCLAEPVHLAGEWAGFSDRALWRLALDSTTGVTLVLRALGLATLAIALGRPGRGARSAALAGALVIIGSFLLSGHTVSAPQRPLLAPLLGLHLACVAFWFGALAPLRQLCRLEGSGIAAGVLAAFSSAALWLVPPIALAGIALAALLLPDLAALRTPYGGLLIAKAALFAVLMGLAALNRLRLVPELARGEAQAAGRLRRSIVAEYLLICVVLALTAVLTGFYSPADGAEGAGAAGGATARA